MTGSAQQKGGSVSNRVVKMCVIVVKRLYLSQNDLGGFDFKLGGPKWQLLSLNGWSRSENRGFGFKLGGKKWVLLR